MTSKEKSKHKFEEKILKEEDDLGLFSLKRQTLGQTRMDYFYKQLFKTYLFIPAIIIIFIAGILRNWTILIVGGVLIFIGIIISLINANYEDLNDEEDYVRRSFDKSYGKGQYDKTMKNKDKRENEKWKK